MTAIAGVVGARADSATLVQQLLDGQRRYGSHKTNIAALDGSTFGISRRTPSNGPSVAVGAHLLVVADLRLSNRDDLVGRAAAGLPTESDTELLLAVWAKAEEECLDWIAGDFALAVFDSRTRRLTLARDPSGQLPLHYAQVGEALAFASMPTGLRPFLHRLALDRTALAMHLCDLRDDDPRSHFEGICRVLPGEAVRFESPSIHRRIYWNPPTAWDDPLRNVDLVEGYRHALDTAVRDSLGDSARPVATHLSSGYDSSAITATAARLVAAPNEIIAFTSAPMVAAPVPERMWRIADESEIAAQTAAALGVRHVVVRDSPPIADVLRRLSSLCQEPLLNIPNRAWLLQIRREAAAAGADCLLWGGCGNVSLNAGGLYVLADWIRRSSWLTWARQARLAAARPDTRWRGVLYNSFRPWIPTPVSDMLRRRYMGAGPSDGVTFLRPEWSAKAFGAVAPPPSHANSYEERIHAIRNDNVGVFRKGGLAGEGIDERDPLADRRLVEFSLRVPPEHLYWDGVPRPLARAALADRLPRQVIDLKLRGLQSADWAMRFTQAEAIALLEEISASPTAHELLDVDRMRHAIDRWPTEQWNRPVPHFTYRVALMSALAAGMFALVHEQAPATLAGTA